MVEQIDPVTGAVVALVAAGIAAWQRRVAIMAWLGVRHELHRTRN